jgi:hypothetical protein
MIIIGWGEKHSLTQYPPNNTLFDADNVELEHLMFPQGVVHFQHASYFHIEKVCKKLWDVKKKYHNSTINMYGIQLKN